MSDERQWTHLDTQSLRSDGWVAFRWGRAYGAVAEAWRVRRPNGHDFRGPAGRVRTFRSREAACAAVDHAEEVGDE